MYKMLETLITAIEKGEYKTIFVSTTSKASPKVSRLPDKNLAGQYSVNVLITDNNIGMNFFERIDGRVDNIFIDVERKQGINLMSIARDIIKYSSIHPYKPNDVTLEAADQLILNQLGTDLTDSRILVYGTGNLAFKIALRLIEREADVTIAGRNLDKIRSLVSTLNMVKPSYSNAMASEHENSCDVSYDGLISFLSSEKIIDSSVVKWIKPKGFAIDGGIGNFQGEFIAEALNNEISILRLDVRLGNPFLFAGIESLSSKNEFFNTVMGSRELDGITLVAGGIIGKSGSIIVDQIHTPKQLIGVANGYGGLKNDKQLTESDRENLQYARKALL